MSNNVQQILVEKVSNTEKLAGLVLKILKWLGILFIIILIIDVISLILFAYFKNDELEVKHTEEIEIQCSIENNNYIITIANDGYFNCSNCSKEIQLDLKNNYIDFSNIDKSKDNVFEYFKSNNGICE